MTYQENFNNLKKILMKADVSKIDGELAFQFNIVGDGDGIFYAKVKNGQLSVEPYDYHDRDAIFIGTAKVFTKLVQGKLNPVVAFTTGKLKVEGNLDKAIELQKITFEK
ncbi:SCP2 sterol-binding domain-containing protein [Clostridium sp.]|uniref:SCP2 sterol-binding domain-containing protein n=1 Tax=Clostridium sp. TaxID=1506 RepID=UPI00284D7B54|nr:SCP2 sterol-binding domain-containing protein [Clostridium sp.]MDR3594646.1 SCP2 sterol-binding domain-containing protein [Clostridium sp.]